MPNAGGGLLGGRQLGFHLLHADEVLLERLGGSGIIADLVAAGRERNLDAVVLGQGRQHLRHPAHRPSDRHRPVDGRADQGQDRHNADGERKPLRRRHGLCQRGNVIGGRLLGICGFLREQFLDIGGDRRSGGVVHQESGLAVEIADLLAGEFARIGRGRTHPLRLQREDFGVHPGDFVDHFGVFVGERLDLLDPVLTLPRLDRLHQIGDGGVR